MNINSIFKDWLNKDFSKIKAREFEDLVVEKLEKYGKIIRQFKVQDRGDGRKGKIDVFLKTSQETIAIEIDRLTPRAKSIFKLKISNANKIFAFTRSPFQIYEILR